MIFVEIVLVAGISVVTCHAGVVVAAAAKKRKNVRSEAKTHRYGRQIQQKSKWFARVVVDCCV